MKKLFILLFCLIGQLQTSNAQDNPASYLYHKAFGNPANPSIIFIHSGPGHSSVIFEETTAPKLAKMGYYVIVYDQRACGRSGNIPYAKYTIDEAINDLESIKQHYKVKKPTLLGHQWGGSVAIFYGYERPDSISRIILCSTPLTTYKEWMHTAIDQTKQSMRVNQDMKYYQTMDNVETGDTTTDYFYINFHSAAELSGTYLPNKRTDSAKKLINSVLYGKNADIADQFYTNPVKGFFSAEHYSNIIFEEPIKGLTKKVKIYALYGWEDKTFSGKDIKKNTELLGKDKVRYILGAGHYPYIDNQEAYLFAVNQIIKPTNPAKKPIKKATPKPIKK